MVQDRAFGTWICIQVTWWVWSKEDSDSVGLRSSLRLCTSINKRLLDSAGLPCLWTELHDPRILVWESWHLVYSPWVDELPQATVPSLVVSKNVDIGCQLLKGLNHVITSVPAPRFWSDVKCKVKYRSLLSPSIVILDINVSQFFEESLTIWGTMIKDHLVF